jgi:hypothetical protein
LFLVIHRGEKMAKSKSIGCGGIVLILLVIGFIGSLFRGGGDSSPEASTTPSRTNDTENAQEIETFSSFGCLPVSESLINSIGQGFETSTLTGRAAGFVARQYADVKFVAVEFVPNGLSEPEVAVFGTNDDDISDVQLNGLIIAVDGFAKEFSDWGDAPNIGLSIGDEGAQEAVECLDLPGYKLADPPVSPSAFDRGEFIKLAGEKYGVFDETFDDGSTLTVMDLAYSICQGNPTTMKRNLGSKWDSSFQKYVLESLCPEKLN